MGIYTTKLLWDSEKRSGAFGYSGDFFFFDLRISIFSFEIYWFKEGTSHRYGDGGYLNASIRFIGSQISSLILYLFPVIVGILRKCLTHVK